MNALVKGQLTIFKDKMDRDLIELEASQDPEFERQLHEALKLPDGAERVAMSAKKAFLNDLKPELYPEMAGTWPVLRSIMRKVFDKVTTSTASDMDKITKQKGSLGDLGQDFSAIVGAIAPLIGTVASVGASVYSAHVVSQAQTQIAQEQLQANMAEIKAQEAMASAQTAIANAQTQQAVSNVLPGPIAAPVAAAINAATTDVGGIKVWELALLAYFFIKG